MNKKNSFLKELIPLCVPQTLGVFNDNAFKSVVIFTALGMSNDYGYNAFLMGLMTVIYVLPFLIFVVPAGFAADRFSKRTVLILTKFAEFLIMLSGAYFFFYVKDFGVYPLVFVLFFMAMQSSFFCPSFYGILPEIYTEKEISRANGIIGMFSFIGIITGFASGIIVKSFSGERLYLCGLFLSIISVIGFIYSLKIRKTSNGNKRVKWNKKVFDEFKKTLLNICSKKDVFLSILGEAYFYAFGASMQTILILYGKYILHLEKDIELGFLQFFIAAGIAVGCFAGGKLSRNKLELGLSLYGGFCIFIFLLLTVLIQGSEYILSFSGLNIAVYPLQIFLLFCFGIASGIFIIPLRVCQQERTKVTERGQVIAFSNFFIFSSIFISGIITFILTGGYETKYEAVFVNKLFFLKNFIFRFSPSNVMIIIAILTLIFCIIAVFIHKEFLFRSISIFITRFVYKVRSTGEDNIPFNKPVIFVSNHVSYIDEFIIGSATSQNIKFIIYENDKTNNFLYKIFRYFEYIKRPENDSGSKYKAYCEEIKKTLKAGQSVCIFPERQITKNGLTGKFHNEITNIVPEGINIPLIPVYIGPLWGSIFSYYKNKIKKGSKLINICFGKPLSVTTAPFKIRQTVCELAAESEKLLRPGEKTLHYNFLKLAKRNPFKKILFDFEGKSLNMFSILLRSLLLSNEIKKIKKSKFAGILLPNCNAATITILASMFSDLVPAVLNYSLSENLFDASIKNSKLDLILTSKLFIKKANISRRPEMVFLEDIAKNITLSQKLYFILLIVLVPSWLLIKLTSKRYKNVYDSAILLFSSGSTGIPKGVLLTHHNLNSNVNCYLQVMGCNLKKDKITGNLPFFHSFGINIAFWLPLMYGITVVYIKNPLDVSSVLNAVKKYRLTLLASTPTFMNSYIRKSEKGDFKSLRLLILGAEKMNSNHVSRFKACIGIEPIEGFGCTELSPIVSINIPENIKNPGIKTGKPGSIGKALNGIATKIVDIENLMEVEPEKEGLLFVKAPTVMKGYLNDKKATEKIIIDGWYNTKDIASQDEEGYITITGRISRFSKIGGEMVSHEIIEHLINDINNGETKTVVVTDVKDEQKGEKLIVLYTQLNLTIDKISDYLKSMGMSNLWIPKNNNYFKVDEIPVLGSGKLDLRKLKELAKNCKKM